MVKATTAKKGKAGVTDPPEAKSDAAANADVKITPGAESGNTENTSATGAETGAAEGNTTGENNPTPGADEAAEAEAKLKAEAEAQAEKDKAKAGKPVREPHHQSFFKQYLELMKKGGVPAQAIKAANNGVKAMLAASDNKAFDDIYAHFKAEKMVMTPKVILQAAATLPANERATLEIITTILYSLANDSGAQLNLEYARGVIKNDAFITWVAKIRAK